MKRTEFLRHLFFGSGALLLRPAHGPWLHWGIKEIPRRQLGRTGEAVSMIGLGGWHLGSIKQERDAIRMIHRAIDAGVNFVDTAESYQKGGSETRIGNALRGRRQKVFLMTKTYEPAQRDAEGARRHLEGSLRRLQTDYLDLWQLHSVQSPEDVDRAFRDGGAMETILKAREEGKVRFVGVTGHHDPAANLRAIYHWDQGWTFDTMQMPINPMDYHQKSFQKQVLPELAKRQIGVIAMKTSASGKLLQEKLATVDECLHYVWSLAVNVAVVGMVSEKELLHNLGLARAFAPMSDAEKQRLLTRLRPNADLNLEWYKV